MQLNHGSKIFSHIHGSFVAILVYSVVGLLITGHWFGSPGDASFPKLGGTSSGSQTLFPPALMHTRPNPATAGQAGAEAAQLQPKNNRIFKGIFTAPSPPGSHEFKSHSILGRIECDKGRVFPEGGNAKQQPCKSWHAHLEHAISDPRLYNSGVTFSDFFLERWHADEQRDSDHRI